MQVENADVIDAPTSGDEASAEVILDRDDLEDLFKSVSGLGEKKIEKIFETFGEDEIVEILEQSPSEFSQIKGIKDKTIKKIVQKWVEFKEDRIR